MSAATQEQKLTEADIKHPSWCRRSHCEVRVREEDNYICGDHYSGARPISTLYGAQVVVQLVLDSGEDQPKVALRHRGDPVEVGDDWNLPICLEPEEAELLARQLIDAAAPWREVNR